ncbi:unnamed protein product [Acanthosepion pharaonis]|uniref:Uncharacterized protein n=1 Tax=Acanthosepion pharaonis TaxID=158019 RepID=A0A812BCL6_ACAPH|nr:unnamed protein product [Sepia pharaonis]
MLLVFNYFSPFISSLFPDLCSPLSLSSFSVIIFFFKFILSHFFLFLYSVSFLLFLFFFSLYLKRQDEAGYGVYLFSSLFLPLFPLISFFLSLLLLLYLNPFSLCFFLSFPSHIHSLLSLYLPFSPTFYFLYPSHFLSLPPSFSLSSSFSPSFFLTFTFPLSFSPSFILSIIMLFLPILSSSHFLFLYLNRFSPFFPLFPLPSFFLFLLLSLFSSFFSFSFYLTFLFLFFSH